jgi:hypothetical protein
MRPVKLVLTWIKVLGLRRRTAKLGELGFDSREIGGNVLTYRQLFQESWQGSDRCRVDVMQQQNAWSVR